MPQAETAPTRSGSARHGPHSRSADPSRTPRKANSSAITVTSTIDTPSSYSSEPPLICAREIVQETVVHVPPVRAGERSCRERPFPASPDRRKLLSLPAVLALIVRIALFTTRRIPARQPPSSPRLTARPGPLARR